MTPFGALQSCAEHVLLLGAMGAAWLFVHPSAVLGVYAAYYLTFAVRTPKLTYRPTEKTERILKRCSDLRRPFFPCPVALQPDLAIILYAMRERLCGSKPTYDREEIWLDDGGLVAIDWLGGRPAEPTDDSAADRSTQPTQRPIVLICGGVTFDSNDLGVRELARAVVARGWRAAVYLRRGHGGLPLKTARFNVFGDTADTHAVVTHIQRLRGAEQAPVALVGISAGSALAVRYVGEQATPMPHPLGWARNGPGEGWSPLV